METRMKKEPLLSEDDWRFVRRMFLVGLVFGFLGSSLMLVLMHLLS